MENKVERRTIPGWEGIYSADSDGNIHSNHRVIMRSDGRKRTIPYRVLKLQKHWKGYRMITLYHDGVVGSYLVHRLVAAAFGLIELNNIDEQIDHINHIKSDNRLENLRKATAAQNQAHGGASLYATNTSGFRGVHWCANRWKARISVKNKTQYIGRFKNIIDAAKAYDEAAKEYFGDFAYQNFPD